MIKLDSWFTNSKLVYDFTYTMTKGDLFYKHYERDNASYIKRTPWLKPGGGYYPFGGNGSFP